MANLSNKNGVFLARFRFQDKEYKKSLKTTDRRAAEAAMQCVEDALQRPAINVINVSMITAPAASAVMTLFCPKAMPTVAVRAGASWKRSMNVWKMCRRTPAHLRPPGHRSGCRGRHH